MASADASNGTRLIGARKVPAEWFTGDVYTARGEEPSATDPGADAVRGSASANAPL